MMNKKRLGRGLSALIPNRTSCILDDETEEKRKIQTNNDNKDYLNLPIDLVHPNKHQPRQFFDKEILNELAESIKKNGVIQPIIVRKVGEEYQIIAGERRFRAAKIVGLIEIPAIIKDLNDNTSLEISIIENVQRENLNPLEEALAYKKLAEEFSYRHEDISSIVGKSRSYVTNFLRILLLPEKVKNYLKDGIITMGHAKLLINLENCEKIADEIIKKSLNVRQTEDLIKTLSRPSIKIRENKREDLKMLERKISENLGMKVIITDDNDKYGSVKVIFRNLGDLEKILKRLS